MTEAEFRSAMNAASREDRILWVADDDDFGVAVGIDSGRGVILMHNGREMNMAPAREIRPF